MKEKEQTAKNEFYCDECKYLKHLCTCTGSYSFLKEVFSNYEGDIYIEDGYLVNIAEEVNDYVDQKVSEKLKEIKGEIASFESVQETPAGIGNNIAINKAIEIIDKHLK